MSTDFSAFLVVAAGTAINAAGQVTTGKGSPARTFAGGALFGLVCVAVNELTGSSLGTMLAAVFLLSSFLSHGVPVLTAANTLVQHIGK